MPLHGDYFEPNVLVLRGIAYDRRAAQAGEDKAANRVDLLVLQHDSEAVSHLIQAYRTRDTQAAISASIALWNGTAPIFDIPHHLLEQVFHGN